MATFMKYWPILALVIQILTVWVCWSLRQLAITEVKRLLDVAVAALIKTDQAAEETIDDHEGRLTRVEKDVEQIRTDISNLPTKADLKTLEGEVKVVVKGVELLQKGISRIEAHFIEEGMKGAKP